MIHESSLRNSSTCDRQRSRSGSTQPSLQKCRSRWITGKPVDSPKRLENTDFPEPHDPMTKIFSTESTTSISRFEFYVCPQVRGELAREARSSHAECFYQL